MIYEVRTYRLKQGTTNKAIDAFAEAYEHRKKYSELAAFWYTEIGPLNEIIHVWPYKDLDERTKIRAEANKDPNWPPKIGEFLQEQQSEIFHPFPFTPKIEPGNVGPVFEWRDYIVKPGMIPNIIDRWKDAIDTRTERSPCTMIMHTELGALNRMVHIWPYKDLEHRKQVRDQAAKDGIWPPKGGDGTLHTQDNKILYAAPFSPIQ
jgi:hypothetical protein